MITLTDTNVMLALARYHVLSRPQIQGLCFPKDSTGRGTRRRLQILVEQRLINRQHVMVVQPNGGSPASVYYPAPLGCEFLAGHFGDDRYLMTSTVAPIPHHCHHWLAVSETHIVLDNAIATDGEARIEEWINEYDEIDKDAKEAAKRFRLYTVLREEPKLVCVPDAAFLLSMAGHKKVFYLEQDRATTGAKEVADRKTKGYAAMAEVAGHRRHFPNATVDAFTVICVSPNANRRDVLRKTIRGRVGEKLWRFVSISDLTSETALLDPIFYPCDGEPGSLIKKREGA